MNHGIAVDGGIEEGRLLVVHLMLRGEGRQRRVLALDIATGFQEEVHLLGHGLHAGLTDTVAFHDLGLGLLGLEVRGTRLQAAAAEGAERDDLLAAEVHLTQIGEHGRGEDAKPHGSADEDDVIVGHVGFHRVDLDDGTRLSLLHTAGDGGVKVLVIGGHGLDGLDVGSRLSGYLLGHSLGVAQLGIVDDKHLGRGRLGLFLRPAGGSSHRHHRQGQHHFHCFHTIFFYSILFSQPKLFISNRIIRINPNFFYLNQNSFSISQSELSEPSEFFF